MDGIDRPNRGVSTHILLNMKKPARPVDRSVASSPMLIPDLLQTIALLIIRL
jgi:hypothetical protein